MLLLVLPTELLREAMDGARQLGATSATRVGSEFGGGGGFEFGGYRARRIDPLATLKSAIAIAAAEGVDGAMLQEAKTLLATKQLQTAMEQREVAGLRAAIEVAEREVAVDRTVVEVSKWVLDTKSHSASNACLIRYTSGSIVGCTHPVASHTPVGGGGPAAAASHRASSGSDGRHTEASRS